MGVQRLKRLEALAGRRTTGHGREWTPEGAVHQDEEHVLAVLCVLRDVGALGDVLKDEGLEAAALELLEAAELSQPIPSSSASSLCASGGTTRKSV